MGLYDIQFTVTRDGVTPTEPQRAGVYGDEGQATVVFTVASDLRLDGYRYRVEVVDGAGGYDVTELMEADSGKITIEIPSAWTSAGVASLRLVAVEVGEDGEEARRFHSRPALIFFDDREDGEFVRPAAEAVWQSFLEKSTVFVEEANKLAKDAEEAARSASESADTAAEKAAEVVGQYADSAANNAIHAEECAKTAKVYSDSAAASAERCNEVLLEIADLVGITESIKRVVGV